MRKIPKNKPVINNSKNTVKFCLEDILLPRLYDLYQYSAWELGLVLADKMEEMTNGPRDSIFEYYIATALKSETNNLDLMKVLAKHRSCVIRANVVTMTEDLEVLKMWAQDKDDFLSECALEKISIIEGGRYA